MTSVLGYVIIGLFLAALVAFCIRDIYKNVKNEAGACMGSCGGECGKCSGCSSKSLVVERPDVMGRSNKKIREMKLRMLEEESAAEGAPEGSGDEMGK